MKKQLLFLFATLLPMLASAQTKVEIDGIWYNLTSETQQAEVTSGDTKYSGSITIPAMVTYNGVDYSVTSIGYAAFQSCTSLTDIILPEGVTSIGGHAFHDCSSLASITIPEGVTSIGNDAFYNTAWYNNQPDGVIYVGRVLYKYKGTMSANTSVEVKEGTVSIGDYAFLGCSSLTSITIPEGVTSIGSYAFYNTAWYDNQPDGVIYAGRVLYKYKGTMPANTSVEVKEGTVSIGSNAFEGCSSLTTITIPESVTSIGEWAFSRCSLTTITIPEGVTIIEHYAFWNCNSLTDIILPEGVTSIGTYAFNKCSSLTAINIPEGVTSIGYGAFSKCSSLTAINIPASVTSIGSSAFYECNSLKEVTFGKGLKKIESGSFSGCSSIEKITIHATQPPATDGYIFDDAVYENATLYVPQGSIAKYQVMTGWSGFYNISEMEGGTPDYLTIRQADNGEVGIAVDLGRSYKVCITPSTGWTIHSVTFNGKDMTAQLSTDNTFTIPTLTASAVLNVAYVKEGTAINNANASRLSVRGHNGIISISGAAESEAITIYTLDGTMVASEEATDDTTSIEVPTQQVYIVKVADTVVKIGM